MVKLKPWLFAATTLMISTASSAEVTLPDKALVISTTSPILKIIIGLEGHTGVVYVSCPNKTFCQVECEVHNPPRVDLKNNFRNGTEVLSERNITVVKVLDCFAGSGHVVKILRHLFKKFRLISVCSLFEAEQYIHIYLGHSIQSKRNDFCSLSSSFGQS